MIGNRNRPSRYWSKAEAERLRGVYYFKEVGILFGVYNVKVTVRVAELDNLNGNLYTSTGDMCAACQ
jgi:hypothetical protein